MPPTTRREHGPAAQPRSAVPDDAGVTHLETVALKAVTGTLLAALVLGPAHAQSLDDLLVEELGRADNGRILLTMASLDWQQNSGVPVEPEVAALRQSFRTSAPRRCESLLKLMKFDYRASRSPQDQRLLDSARRYLGPLQARGLTTATLENPLTGMLAWGLLRDEPPLCACLLPADATAVLDWCARFQLRPDGNWPY